MTTTQAKSTCRCDGSGTYRAELPNSGDTGSGYVKCPCGASDRRLEEVLANTGSLSGKKSE